MNRRALSHFLLAAIAAALVLAGAAGADVVVIAPVGAGTTAGSSLVPATAPSTSGGSGNGAAAPGGAGFYFETANLSRGLPWDAIPAADWAAWHRTAAAGDGKLTSELENSADPSSIERRLVSSSCGDKPTSAGNCFLWFNSCPTGAQALHKRSFDGAADRGQIACRTSNWKNVASEFHPLASWGGQAQMDELSQWEVQVWREGTSQPIFERRVALDASGHPIPDADGPGIPNDWWLSGGALAGATDATAAGPLGGWRDASDASYRGCDARYRQAPRTVVGSFDVDGAPAAIAYDNGALGASAPTVGGSTYDCFWGGWSNGGRSWLPASSSSSKAPCATCFYEGIQLSWQVPSPGSYHGGAVQANFSYRLLGRPNTFYAIRIVSLDNREQLLMTNALQPKQHLYWSQYFRVFMPTSISGFDFTTPACTQCNTSP